MTTPMINITETASAKVRELLEEQGKTDHALRIFVRGMSCSGPAYGMALDNEPRQDDAVTELNGVKILVDPLSAQYVEGAEVDYVEGLMGRGFTVMNPTLQAQSGGGCGGGCSCGH
jgi:iron-sulfur cluster assembly accessory protein